MSAGPYTKIIKRTSVDSHQTSPAYVATIIRWSNRDTANYLERVNKEGRKTITRTPLVIINDIVSVNTDDMKNQLTPSVSMVLKAGDLNYSTAVAPGDYLLLNLVDTREQALNIRERALNIQPINRYGDGFKGLFKIQTVRRQVIVDPNTGTKNYNFVIHGFGFTEFNSLIYYNPILSLDLSQQNVFLSHFKNINEVVTSLKNVDNVQSILQFIIKKIIGQGLNKSDRTINSSSNERYIVPPLLGPLLNRPKAKTIADIYNFVFGIWKGSTFTNNSNVLPKVGFNPNIEKIKNDNNFYKVKGASNELKGWRQYAFQDFNQKTIWSILKTYLNGAINESYTTTRIGTDGYVYPTVIFRQKPFSSNHFDNPVQINNKPGAKKPKAKISHTKFRELPRWKVASDLIYQIDLGKDEAARINFIQFTGRAIAVDPNINAALQAGNNFFDNEDIKRHGLRPSIVSSNFDYSSGDANLTRSKDWAYLLFDMQNAGQLRESGAISCVGIEDPICVGDNLEFDGNIYHIEQVSHHMSIEPQSGKKIFRTNLKLSFGTSLNSTDSTPVYSQMEFTDTLTERKRDRVNEDILPGFSDTQDLPGNSRELGEEVKETKEESFTRGSVSSKGRNRFSSLKFNDPGIRSKNKNKDKK